MTVPTVATYSAAAKVAAHTAFRDLIDAGTGPGYIAIRDAYDVLLSTIDLDDPCGTVNGTTGQLTFDIPGPDTSAAASGTAAYGEFCDSDDNVHLSLPAQAGAAPASGYIVLNTLTIVATGEVQVISATIG
jgi:hypothetical protein